MDNMNYLRLNKEDLEDLNKKIQGRKYNYYHEHHFVAEKSQRQEVRNLDELKGVRLGFWYRLLFMLRKKWSGK